MTLDTWFAVGIAILAAPAPAAAKEPPETPTYVDHVFPVFRDACLNCHNADRARGGLDLSTYEAVMAGGGGGAVVTPGAGEDSRLYRLAAHLEEPKMPPRGDGLAKAKLEILKGWIDGGLLETSSSTAKVAKKSNVQLDASAVASGRPSEPLPPPEHLLMEPLVRTDRAGAAPAMAANPWAPLVAVAGQKQVLLFDLDRRDLAGVLSFPEGRAHSLKFSRNGRLLVAGGGKGASRGLVVVWNVADGERVLEVGDERDEVLAADLSADQSLVALSGPGKRLKIFSAVDGSLRHDVKKHADWVLGLEFSPDGVLLASADRGGALHVWEAMTGREFYALNGHKGGINDLSWRADSNVLASASEDGTIKLWEMFKGSQVKSWNAHGGGVLSVHFTHDGRLVSSGRDRKVKVWDQNGKLLKAFPDFPELVLEAVFGHEGKTVVAADWSGEIRVGDPAEGKWTGALAPHPPTVSTRLAEAQTVLGEAEKTLLARQQTVAEAEKAAAGPQAAVEEALALAQAVEAELGTAQQALGKEDASLATVREAHEKVARAYQTLVDAAAAQRQALQSAEAGHAAAQVGYDEIAAGVEAKRALVRSLEQSLRQVEAELEKVPGDEQLRALQEQSASSAQAAKRFFLESRQEEVAAATALVEGSLAVKAVAETAAVAQAQADAEQAGFQKSAARLARASEQREAVHQEVIATQQRRDQARQGLEARQAAAAPFVSAWQKAQSELVQARARRDAAAKQVARWTAELINIELYASRDQVDRCIVEHETREVEAERAGQGVEQASERLEEAKAVWTAAPAEIERRQQALAAAQELPRAAEELLAVVQAKLDGKQDFRALMSTQSEEVSRRAAVEPDNAVLAEAAAKAGELVALLDRDLEAVRAERQGAEAKLVESRSQVGAAEQALAAARKAEEDARLSVAQREVELEESQARVEAARARVAEAQAAIEAARERVEELRRQYLAALPAGA